MKKKKFDLMHLFTLGCFSLILLSFFLPKTNNLQLEICILAVLTYVTFSLLHHFMDKTLTLETTIEYILLATLALILSVGVLS
jgi:hypothetical protein